MPGPHIRITIHPSYRHLADEINRFIAEFDHHGVLVFAGRNTLKSFVCSDGTKLVIKRFGRLNLLRRLIYSTISTSKARRAYESSIKFGELGVATPAPVAYAEMYRSGLISDAYFVSRHTDSRPLFRELVESPAFDSAMADRVAGLMWHLHSHGAMHGDPNLTNILIGSDANGNSILEVIDTNRSCFGKNLSRRSMLRNLMRVTHRRDLSAEIVAEYSRLSGLEPQRTILTVKRMLLRFERNRAIRHRLKALVHKPGVTR